MQTVAVNGYGCVLSGILSAKVTSRLVALPTSPTDRVNECFIRILRSFNYHIRIVVCLFVVVVVVIGLCVCVCVCACVRACVRA